MDALKAPDGDEAPNPMKRKSVQVSIISKE